VIISQAPYRVSLAGGGTDLPAFYRHEVGAVLSMAIQRHMCVTVSHRFDETTRVAYTRTEIAATLDEIEHEIAREALRMTGLGRHLEITTVGDVPAGTGMGSSSTLTVGLLQALYGYKGEVVGAERLAEEACQIEIDILGKPIGRQDQYAAAFGGLNYIEFHPDDTVRVEPVPISNATLRAFEEQVLLVYTETQRSADRILEAQCASTAERMPVLREMRAMARELRGHLTGEPDFGAVARLLHHGWELKRSITPAISNGQIDDMYACARKEGALGGKLLGAGGGGFLLLMAPRERHGRILDALENPRTLPFAVDRRGSRIIFISGHGGH